MIPLIMVTDDLNHETAVWNSDGWKVKSMTEMLDSCDQGAIALTTSYTDGYFRNVTVLNATFTYDPFFSDRR